MAVVHEGDRQTRISIFLNIFDVHVNRSPISGVITDITYQKGKFLVASREIASAENEQNIITVRAEGRHEVVFKQIAGLHRAPHRLLPKSVGDFVQAGERVGLIKFGSRVDVISRPGMARRSLAGYRASAPVRSILARRGGDVVLPLPLAASIEEAALCQNVDQPEVRRKKRPPRAAYALPTLFTAGNIFLGFLSIIRSIQGAMNFAHEPQRWPRRISKWPRRPSDSPSSSTARRPHRAHDEHHQRVRPRTRFAGRYHQLRHRSRHPRLYVGRQFVAGYRGRGHARSTAARR